MSVLRGVSVIHNEDTSSNWSHWCTIKGYSMSPRDSIYWGDDYTLIKYDSSGSMLWEARYSGPDNLAGWVYALAIDPEDYVYTAGFILTGTRENYGYDWCTIRYPPSGPGIAEPGSPVAQIGEMFKVCPNPAGSFFVIEARQGLSSVRLYDVAGKMIKEYSGKRPAGARLSLDGISSGVYILRAATATGTFTGKLVVNKLNR